MTNDRPSPPADFDALRDTLLAQRGALPKRLTQIAGFAIDNPDEIAFGTVASIAAMVGVQPSALVRFAQALGYQGFSQMQGVFRSRLREGVADYRERLETLKGREAAGGVVGLLDGFAEAAAVSVDRLRRVADPVALEGMVAALAPAETIYLVGQRRSFPVTSYLSYAMAKLGIRNLLIDNVASMAPEVLGFAGPRDAALVVSFTPYAPVTVDLARLLEQRRVPIAAITDSAFSPITQAASAWVEVVEADFGGFRSLAGTLTLSIALAVAIAERRAPA